MQEDIVIQKKSIAPGTSELVKLQVGTLPSGNKIYIQVHIFRAPKPGPKLLVLAGVHGDEINGVEIVRRSIELGMFEQLQKGSIIAIPLVNVFGFINFSREVPDGKDVNRSFPGTMTGSLASRVARTITKKVLPIIDMGVDFHTGGRSHYNYPQIRYSKGDIMAQKLAQSFAPPYCISNTPIPKSLRKVALEMEKSILVYEGGENLRFDGFSIERGLAGLQRLMHSLDMVGNSTPPEQPTRSFTKTSWIRAGRAGIFRWSKPSGHQVHKGEPLGIINDPYGQEELVIYSSKDGYIIGHNNAPVVSQGDALFHIGFSPNVL